MATSLVGPYLTDRALTAAPVPRPPQPIRATLMVLSSPAWTCGTAMPAKADAPGPDDLRGTRRRRRRKLRPRNVPGRPGGGVPAPGLPLEEGSVVRGPARPDSVVQGEWHGRER